MGVIELEIAPRILEWSLLDEDYVVVFAT